MEERPIPVTELKSLKEVAACGTAVVVTPVNRIVYKDEVRRKARTCNTEIRDLNSKGMILTSD